MEEFAWHTCIWSTEGPRRSYQEPHFSNLFWQVFFRFGVLTINTPQNLSVRIFMSSFWRNCDKLSMIKCSTSETIVSCDIHYNMLAYNLLDLKDLPTTTRFSFVLWLRSHSDKSRYWLWICFSILSERNVKIEDTHNQMNTGL